jgi:hypothetical protein
MRAMVNAADTSARRGDIALTRLRYRDTAIPPNTLRKLRGAPVRKHLSGPKDRLPLERMVSGFAGPGRRMDVRPALAA